MAVAKWSKYDFFGDLTRRTRLIGLLGLLFLGLSLYFFAIVSFDSALALRYEAEIRPSHPDWARCAPLDLFGVGRDGILKSSYNRYVCATVAAPVSFVVACLLFLSAVGLLAFRRP